jgi:hypothetical protein
MQGKTVIVGGGIAGMSCALKLLEAGNDFTLISPGLGGRMMYSPEERVNYGAYFVMKSYAHAKKLIKEEALVNPLHACFHNSETEYFPVLSTHTLTMLPEFVRFFFAMQEFSRHYEPYKKRCLVMTQKKALEADPYMAALFRKPASQFIKEKHYEKVAADYISKFAFACTGVSTDRITALDFLNVSMGILVPIHKFSFDEKGMIRKLGEHYINDKIVKIDSQAGSHVLTGQTGKKYTADTVVVATPASVTKELLGLKEIREACKLYVFHVKAKLKGVFSQYELNLFPPTSDLILTAQQYDGSYLIYGCKKDIDLNRVCEEYTLLRTVDWEKAMYVQGRAYMEQQLGKTIYIAGDHNGLGLEPAAISGIYAANQILGIKK